MSVVYMFLFPFDRIHLNHLRTCLPWKLVVLLIVDLVMTLSEFPSDSQERCGHNVGASGKVIMNMIQCKTINRWRELSLGPVMASIHDSEQGVEAGGQEVLEGDTNIN